MSVRLLSRILNRCLRRELKKDIFYNLVFAGGGWHLRFANYSGPGVSTATNDGN